MENKNIDYFHERENAFSGIKEGRYELSILLNPTSIEQLKEEAEAICGKPQKPELSDKIIAAIKWVDGTVIDVVRQVK